MVPYSGVIFLQLPFERPLSLSLRVERSHEGVKLGEAVERGRSDHEPNQERV